MNNIVCPLDDAIITLEGSVAVVVKMIRMTVDQLLVVGCVLITLTSTNIGKITVSWNIDGLQFKLCRKLHEWFNISHDHVSNWLCVDISMSGLMDSITFLFSAIFYQFLIVGK